MKLLDEIGIQTMTEVNIKIEEKLNLPIYSSPLLSQNLVFDEP